MRVLVFQDNADLGRIWCRFLNRSGVDARLAVTVEDATDALSAEEFDALVVEPVFDDSGVGLSVADLAAFYNPDIQILVVTKSTFLSEGSIFSFIPNARGVLRTPLRPEDLLAYIQHFDDRLTSIERRQGERSG